MKLSAHLKVKSSNKLTSHFSPLTSHLQRGFTLIELLVVIGILGILAAALVATIDPFEQIRKGQDARNQNVAVEFQNAVIRYYTNNLAMPWEDAEGSGGDCDLGADDVAAGTTLDALNDAGCIQLLIDSGELKESFDTAAGLDELFVTEPYSGATVDGSMSVCFAPVSKATRTADNTRYDQDGAINQNCPADPDEDCNWCAI